MAQTELDKAITKAMDRLHATAQSKAFDYQTYIRAFQRSAQVKAETALAEFTSKSSPFRNLTPVFVSVGGGDGEELRSLLKNSPSSHGILVEHSRALADEARRRAYEIAPKKFTVIEGDAQLKVREAINEAAHSVAGGQGQCIAVTCHAVIHELFDRSEKSFDLLNFFGAIFSTDLPTWLTYREPGLPEKWPEIVLLRANCAPSSLLSLAEAIRSRHTPLRTLTPNPSTVGDHLQLNRALAMEVLAKLFYLEDIEHEIDERSTAVEHNNLVNALSMAIGDSALRERRALVRTVSAPTDSFVNLWTQCGVEVVGLDSDNRQTQLAVAESQTRVIAWRVPSGSAELLLKREASQTTDSVRTELTVTESALARQDDLVATALIESLGRAWIESSESGRALTLLENVSAHYPRSSRAYLWSHYNLCLARLFAGENVDPAWFSEQDNGLADQVDLKLLYHAERMEFSRRRTGLADALHEANKLREHIVAYASTGLTLSSAYAMGTANFVLGNLLRHGGQYDHAFRSVAKAESLFVPGLPSHDTELAHCYYSKQISVAMTGKSAFDAPYPPDSDFTTRRFAYALITLSYSHAAWFVGDVGRARSLAIEASSLFAEIGFRHYAERAQNLARLLLIWQALSSGTEADYSYLNPDFARSIQVLIDPSADALWLAERFRSFRPSTAAGLLQFRKFASIKGDLDGQQIELPATIAVLDSGELEMRPPQIVRSLSEADARIRVFLSIPAGLRIPLLPD